MKNISIFICPEFDNDPQEGAVSLSFSDLKCIMGILILVLGISAFYHFIQAHIPKHPNLSSKVFVLVTMETSDGVHRATHTHSAGWSQTCVCLQMRSEAEAVSAVSALELQYYETQLELHDCRFEILKNEELLLLTQIQTTQRQIRGQLCC